MSDLIKLEIRQLSANVTDLHESKSKNAPPIGWVPPISTPPKDPLLAALRAYEAKHGDKMREALQRGW